MIGLTLAVIYALALVAFGKKWEEAYISSTRFMTGWSIVTALFMSLFVLTTSSLGGFLGGLLTGSSLGMLVGWFSLSLAVWGMLYVGLTLSWLQALGAYLMSTSTRPHLDPSSGVYVWKKERLVIGALFFIVGLTKFVG